MRLPYLLTLGALVVWPSLLRAQARAELRFEHYPAGARYTGRKAPLRLRRGTEAWRFRTVIREGYAAEPVNFAGHFVVVTWGCGSPCHTFAIIDARTGEVYTDTPAVMAGAEYQPESRLFVAEPPEDARAFFRDAEGWADSLYEHAYSYYYRWSGHALVPIDSVKVDTLAKTEVQ